MIAADLERFQDNLPTKPYCKDDKSAALLIRPKATAIKKKYIQPNKPTSVKYLVYDIDYEDAHFFIIDNNLPLPNLVAYNRRNRRSHLYYELEKEVFMVENARRGPINYLAAVDYQMTMVLKADQGFSKLISKNVLSPEWNVIPLRKNPWSLGEFEEWITLPAKIPARAKRQGLGRNCDLFDATRYWGYRQVLEFRLNGDRQGFFDVILSFARDYNQATFPVPLNDSEVSATAKSIAKWTWKKYTGQMTNAEFSARQSMRGAQGGKASGKSRVQKTIENRVMANLFSMAGLRQRKIAEILGVQQFSVSRWTSD